MSETHRIPQNTKENDELDLKFDTTDEITVPRLLIDQVIGQEHGTNIIRKAAAQKRNVVLVGEPGTGKSMLGQAMAQLLPKEDLEDILCIPSRREPQSPRILVIPRGEGRLIVDLYQRKAMRSVGIKNVLSIFIPLIIFTLAFLSGQWLMGVFVALIAFIVINQVRLRSEIAVPKLLVDNSDKEYAPFCDATGAHAGALLGDVRHDPFQSGGLGTPSHERVEAGLIHRAHRGILFIDEMATLKMKSQQDLLTAMQEKKFQITGQSELSSGAMVRTEKVPCDFILVAAGNYETLKGIHPALRSRIRGSGYEVYMKETIPDTMENRRNLARFVAQEVVKDGKIPHFYREAVLEIIREAR